MLRYSRSKNVARFARTSVWEHWNEVNIKCFFQGMYRLTVDNVEHYIAVFRQVFSDNLKIHTKYKLKGSTVDREASQKERAKDSPLYKDNDFLQDGVKVTIGPEAKKMVMETLDADVAFLAKNQLMDYSLILGVHNRATAEEEKLLNQNQEDSNLDNEEDEEGEDLDEDSGLPSALTPPDSPPFQDMDPLDPSGEHLDQEKDIYALPSKDQNEVYFLALVDILTTYGVKKQAAKYAKTVTYGANKVEGISTIEPDQYAARFLEFIANAME